MDAYVKAYDLPPKKFSANIGKILTIIYKPSVEFQLDREEVVADNLPLEALRLKRDNNLVEILRTKVSDT